MSRYLAVTMLALIAAAGCVNASDGSAAVNADARRSDDDSHSVNGSVHVPAGIKRGDVTTVNGSIRVDDAATVSAAHTVNGDIRVGEHATVESLHTGSLTLRDDSQVTGAVSNVNGTMTLTAAHVAGGLQTVSGNITLHGNCHIEGGILVRKPSSNMIRWESSSPRIVIGPGASVDGSLVFEREVRLYVSDQAKVGPITGATPIPFSDENPPG